MEFLLLMAAISFIAGAFSYIIVRFWITPIWKYRKTKNRAAASLNQCEARFTAEGGKPDAALQKELRVHSVALSELTTLEIPHWYHMVLTNRKEFPDRAAEDLSRLSSITDAGQGMEKIRKIREALLLRSGGGKD